MIEKPVQKYSNGTYVVTFQSSKVVSNNKQRRSEKDRFQIFTNLCFRVKHKIYLRALMYT
jgi:hypothetical protein